MAKKKIPPQEEVAPVAKSAPSAVLISDGPDETQSLGVSQERLGANNDATLKRLSSSYLLR